MIEVEMNKDFKELEPKFLGPFTKRQLICVVIGLCYGVPVFFILTGLDIYIRLIISIVIMIPAIACGWVNMYGLPFEKFVIHMVKTKFILPSRRIVSNLNNYEEFVLQERQFETNDIKNKNRRNKKDGRIK